MSNNPNISVDKVQNPLSKEDINQLKDTLLKIPLIMDGLKQAQRAGIEVSNQVQELEKQQAQIQQILAVYDKD